LLKNTYVCIGQEHGPFVRKDNNTIQVEFSMLIRANIQAPNLISTQFYTFRLHTLELYQELTKEVASYIGPLNNVSMCSLDEVL